MSERNVKKFIGWNMHVNIKQVNGEITYHLA